MAGERSTRMLAVVIGASTFPNAPKLAQGRAFYISAADVVDYLRSEDGLGLPRRNLLSLFDDSRSPSDQLMDVASFLSRRDFEMKKEGARAEDLLIYYVGHGLFTRGDQAYCLAIRSTNEINEGATSIRAGDLAGVIKEHAAFLRRYLILDCCFSASIYREFQSGPLTAARVQITAELPERGTALLCSSNARDPSLAPHGLDHTMFSNALLEALRNGHPAAGRSLCFSELGDIIKEKLRIRYPDSWVRPEVLSPDQREGDVASIPLFPNPAYAKRGAEEQKVREREDALRRQATEGDAADAARVAAEQKALQEAVERKKAEEERAAQKRAEEERLARQAAEAKRITEARAAAEQKAIQEAAEGKKAEKEQAAQKRAEEELLARQPAQTKRMPVAAGPVQEQDTWNLVVARLRSKTVWIPALICFGVLVIIWRPGGSHSQDQKNLTSVSSGHSDGTSQFAAGNGSAPSSQPNIGTSQQPNPARSQVEGNAANVGKIALGGDADFASRFRSGGSDSAPTVLDNNSGLMWTFKDYWNINGRFLTSWDEAMRFAVTCNAQSYAGYNDWHVPSVAEYRTINASKADRRMDARIFEKTDALIYWASNTPSPLVASYVGFELKDGGYAVSGDRTEHQSADGSTRHMSVRLVRRAR